MSAFAELAPLLGQPLPAAAAATSALAAGLATYVLARAPLRATGGLGPRGLKRQRALAQGDWYPLFEPLLRWFATRVNGLLPKTLVAWLDRRLVRAGDYLGLEAEEYAVLVVFGAVVGTAAGALHAHFTGYGAVSWVMGSALGAFFAQTRIDAQISKRAREITHGLPYVTDLLALAMTAGLDFPGSVRNVLQHSSDKCDALTEELELLLHELAIGHTRRYALEQLAERTQVPAAIELVYAVLQADERGSPLAEILRIQAEVARQKRTAIAEENTAKAQQKMMIPLLLLTISMLIVIMVPMVLKVLDAFERLA